MSRAAVDNPPLGLDVSLSRTPNAQALPYDENYADLADPAKRQSLWAKLKYIPLFDDAYLTLGGESRTRFEYRGYERFGRGLQDRNGNLEQRTRLWADMHLGSHVRLFGELKSGLQSGYTGQVLVSDQKDIDVQQAFAELNTDIGGGNVSLRVGRQEIGIGGFKLFDMREGPNVRRAFDAARLRYVHGPWDGEIFGGYSLNETKGPFDNNTNEDFPFWGARVARDLSSLLPGARLEGLWAHTRRLNAAYDAGVGNDRRDTFSLRFNGKAKKVEYDIEAIGQTGTWRNERVRAGFLTAYASYGFDAAIKPRLGIRFEIASGDGNKTDGRMNTYYQLFARPLTVNGELGRANLTAFGPTLSIVPIKKLTLDATLTDLWRTDANDGIYGAPGQLIRAGNPNLSKQVGVRGTIGARYALSPYWVVGTYLNHVQAGRYIRQTDGKNIDYASFFVTLRF